MDNSFIYFDNNATTPIDDRVLDSMLPYFKENFANANSTHQAGIAANSAVKDARNNVAELINADPTEIIFTSGATESINIALKGLSLQHTNYKKHIITVKTEHKAVVDTCKYLESLGFEIDYLEVNNDGLINLEQLKQIIKKDYTLLVSVMWVNNETGVIQPIQKISTITHQANALFMTDATQAVGKLTTDVLENEIDIMCFSPHKFYGPKGVGALYINKKSKAKILSLQHGGGHEAGLRSGTLNVPAIVGFGEASKCAIKDMTYNEKHISEIRNIIENRLLKINGSFLNGSKSQRLYNTLNICLPNFDANIFIGKYKNIAVSNGSACTSSLIQSSHVLSAMGLDDTQSLGSLRISIGKANKFSDIEKLVQAIEFECKNGKSLL
ncbi:cysteine desulfurase family protein [Flavobacterium subsaxonicum]|uniref:cysteine desulfurase n=1 Tax=Flavobacterium subsaxonicum WB 4.1-42 = DSM 21790 TaxID=1121898 RepID=A0A0A2MN00_9FLAO|nr:cysteine desulfurase family protein [Flavobacterium subsaxonicum]KGO93654.1 cysteine desulfurase [Flavobacterium subsaxonicum WB 4.1-42 = DSM 21790]